MNDVAINIMTLIAIILFARLGMKLFALYQMYKNEPEEEIQDPDLESLSKLDDAIIDLYESDYKDVEYQASVMYQHLDEELFPVSYPLFEVMQEIDINVPNISSVELTPYVAVDFESLCDNLQFINRVKRLRQLYEIRLSTLNRAIDNTTEPLELIESELSSL